MNHDMYSPKAKVGLEPTFFGKVMTFFAAAIALSALGTYVGMTYFMETFMANPWLMYALFALELVIIFTSRMWSTKMPINRLLFAAFAFITGLTLAPLMGVILATAAGAALVGKALMITALTFTATALFGWTTKMNLSGMGGFLFMGLIGLILVQVVGIFMPWGSGTEKIVAGFGVLLFSGFTIYDFQQLKHYPEDRYIDAALNIYLDIFNLFVFILRLLASTRD